MSDTRCRDASCHTPEIFKDTGILITTSSQRYFGAVFVPPGVKINSISYQKLILEPVVKDLSEMMFSGESFLFQQDGAPAHTSNSTQSWLRNNISDFVSKEEWPPYSPDLNPMDYSIWSILESKACAKSHTSIQSLKTSLIK